MRKRLSEKQWQRLNISPCVIVYFTNGFQKGSKRKVYQTDMSSNGFAT
jgi:Uma2 family endonuclease